MADNPYLQFAEQDAASAAPTPQPAAGDNPYMDLAKSDLEQTQQQIRGILDVVSPIDPNKAAEAVKLSRSSGLPEQTVSDNLDEVKKQERIRLLNLQQLMTSSPVLARQLMDPNFAKLAQDNVERMSDLEMAASYFGRSVASGVVNLTAAGTKLLDKVQPFTTSEEELAVLFKNDPAKLKEMRENGAATALSRWALDQQKLANQIMDNAPDQVKAKYGSMQYLTTDTDNAAYMSPVKIISDVAQSLPTTLALMASMYLTKSAAGNTYSSMIEAGATREVAIKEAGRVAAEAMAKYSAASEGAVGYAQQANETRAEADKISLEKIKQNPEYWELIDKEGFSPEAARIYLSAKASEASGSMAGLVDAITNFYGGRFLGKYISEGGALLPRTGKGFLIEALTEAPQSIGEKLGENMAIQEYLDRSQSATEGVGEAGAAGFFIGGLTGGGFSAALGGMEHNDQKAAQANTVFDLLTRINELAGADIVRQRDVQTFAGFMQAVQDEHGGDVNTLYIAPQTLLDTLTAAGADINAVVQSVPSLANLKEQAQNGTDIAIPVADFATHIAGSDYAQAIMPHLKADPTGMTKVEADEYMQNHGEKLKAEVEAVLAQQENKTEFKASMDKVKAEVKAQLDETQRFRSDVTDAYAQLMASFYAVTGAKIGLSPEEMAAKYPIKVASKGMATDQQYDQSGKIITDTPKFKAWFGKSKLTTADGKPQVYYHGTRDDIEQFDLNHPNRKDTGWLGTGVYLTDDDFIAESYARLKQGDGNPNIMPMYARLENPYMATLADKKRLRAGGREAADAFTEELKAKGHDGVILDFEGGGREVVVFDPAGVKSVFNNGEFNPNDANILRQEQPIIGEGEVKRVMKRELGEFTPEEQAAWDEFMAGRPDADRILANLKEHAGTPWAKQATEGVFTRQAMLMLINGQTPNFQSSLESGQVKRVRETLAKKGIDGLWQLLEADGGMMGAAAKPVNNVNSSFINCDPSADCAKYCYATGGNYRYANVVVKSELVTLAVELDPVRAAQRVAREYKATAEFANNKALRLYDKGDGNEAWLPFIKELNKEGIRTQIFSKVPEFLRQVPEMNLRLLSIDNSNMGMADANQDLPVAFVYTGKEQIDMLAKLTARGQIQVVLPVKLGQKLLDGSEVNDLKKAVPEVKPYLCPIDAGFKKLGKTSQQGTWNCTKCDVNGGVGCFHGNATKAQMASLEAKPATPQERAQRIMDLRSQINAITSGAANTLVEAGRVPQGGVEGLLHEVDTLLGELLRDYDAGPEATATGKAGRGIGFQIGGAQAGVSGRRVIPIKPVRDASGDEAGDGSGGGDVYNQDQPTFYSQLQRSVEQAKQAKAPASDWLAIIPKMAGVKAEEIEWTGLKDYLELLGKEQVTKEQILSYLAQNGVQVQEVMKAAPQIENEPEVIEEDNGGFRIYSGDGALLDKEYYDTEEEAQDAMEALTADSTQYGEYTLDNGENYRELLLTLPSSSREDMQRMMYLEAVRRRKSEPQQWVFDDSAEGQELKALQTKKQQSVYKNRHWSEENVLAHIRFNERTDADGNKVLFIEELQSDWAQEGRKKGFGKALRTGWKIDNVDGVFKVVGPSGTSYGEAATMEEAMQIADKNAGTLKGIPEAPFVGDTKGWLNLALKRMIRYAAENGFDKVAFVNGQQSADRYDLSKQISSIAYNPEQKILDAWDLNRRQVMRREITDESQLEDYVGKEVAKRLLEQPLVMGKHLLDGENIKVGGEGMVAFYDKIVPNAVSSLIKKMDSKLEGVTLSDEGFNTAQGAADDALLAELGVEVQGTRPPQQLGFTVTDKMRKMAMQGQPLFQGQQEPRGSFNPETNTITLLKAANLSTFLHEAGHFFLEVNADIAMQADAPAEIVQDMQKVLDWFGVEDLQTWSAMTIDQKRPYHEQFARGFEAYLMEGKSPSLELQGVFQRFRSWLVNIYKQIAGLNVQLDDEIRGVFDRMLASSEAIQHAEAARSFAPLFTSKPPFMTDEEWMAYQQTDMQSSQDAVQELETKSLQDMKWLSNAKSKLLKAMQRENAELRKDVRREVEAEVMAEPVYRAREFFKRGTLDGQPVETPVKLAIPEIEAMYEGNPIIGAIKNALGFGKYGMLGTENGMHPEQAAELFGFTSGDHLIRSLLEAPDPRTVIEQRTDSRMLERYGDINSPQALSRAADEAIHNDARARFVATEANALAKAVGKPKLVTQAAKAYAEQIINRLKIRDIKAGQYAASAARAGREAAQSKDLVEQATAKRNQLINTYAAKAAYAAQDEVIRGVRYLQRFDSKNIAKNVHIDSLEQIWAILDRFDLRRSTSLKQLDRRRSLIEWVDMQRAKGEEPIVPQELLNEAYKVSYKDMTLEDFRGLIESVQNIEHLGRLKSKLIKIQDQREFKAVSGQASETIRENATGSIEDELEKKGLKNAVTSNGREVLAWHRKFASLIRQMDGFKDGGFLWSIFVKPMNEAGTQEASMREGATVKLAELYKLLKGVNLDKKVFIPEIGKSLSFEGRIGIALNMGNETNMQRVLEGEGWSPEQVQAILKPLTREHWQFVQGVWDHINSYWPEIAAKERRLTGVVPEKVQAREFIATAADGTQITMAGGYYPIKYNSDRSSKAAADNAADVLKQMERGLYARAQTARGHLQARVDSVGRPMRYDLGVIDQHLNQVIHDLSWHEYLIDANRLLNADSIDAAIREHYGPEVLKVMKKTLEDIAIGELPTQGTIERGVRYFRSGVSIAAMGWNLSTAFLQPLGLTQSMVRVGPKWVAKGMGRWLRDASSMESTVQWVGEKSEFMRLRAKTMQREISEIRNTISKGETMTAVEGSFFYLIGKMQLVADIPTWIGMYEKAMAENKDEGRAIALADQAVLDSQGGGQIKDLSMVQRGGEWQKLWTNFYSFFNVTYNQLAESVGETQKVGASRLPLLAADFLMLTIVPATLGFFLKAALKGTLGDDDEDKLLKKLAAENISYLFGMMIGLRETSAAISGSMGYEGPAGARIFAGLGKFGTQVSQGEADEAFWRSANDLGGVLLHYPALQIDRTVRGFIELSEGGENPLALLFGPKPKN